MILYNVQVSNATLNTANDLLTITSSALRSLVIQEIDVVGMGTTSAANEIVMFGVGTVGVTPTGVTPQAINAASPAASFTAASGWITQPVVNTLRYHTIPVNANGSRYFWRAANPYDGIPITGGAIANATRSFRPVSGSSSMTIRLRIAEI